MGKSKKLIVLEEELEQSECQLDWLGYYIDTLKDEIDELKRRIYGKKKKRRTKKRK